MSGRKATGIQQLDFVTGQVIATYGSAKEAEEANKISNESKIRKAINERNGYMKKKGLRFRYIKKPKIATKCRQLDYETGQEIDAYESIAKAAIDNFITPEGLTFALKHQNGIMPNRQLRFEYA